MSLGFLAPDRLASVVQEPLHDRYLDVPVHGSNTGPSGRRRLMIEPIVMPSLAHCHVPVMADAESAEAGRRSRAAMKERVATSKPLIAHSLRGKVESGQPHQRIRMRTLAPLDSSAPAVTAVPDASAVLLGSQGSTAESRASVWKAGDAHMSRSSSAPAHNGPPLRYCVDCALERRYGCDPVKGPKHKHFAAQAAVYGGDAAPAGAGERRIALTTKPTFGDRPPLESLILARN